MAVAAASAVSVALLAPATARAHDPFSAQAAVLTTAAPTLDGVMQPGEWASATTFTFNGVPDDGQVWVMHDGTDVYVAFRRIEPTPGTIPRFQLYFDNGHNGGITTGDDAWSMGVTVPGGSQEVVDSFYDGSAGFPVDSSNGGSNDTDGGATYTSGTGELVYELKHPRCTGEVARDVCIPLDGSPVGVTFFFFRGVELPMLFRPALHDDQANFGHLTLAPLVGELPECPTGSTTIDFDGVPTATNISELYAGLGVHFLDDDRMTPMTYAHPERLTQSEPNSATPVNDPGHTSANVPLTISFDTGQSAVGFYLGNGVGAPLPTATVTAYDATGAEIGSVSTTVLQNNVTQFYGIATLAGQPTIRSITIDYGNTLIGEEIDDLCFSAAGGGGGGDTPFLVTTTSDDGPGSLRQAIHDANANGGHDTIAFEIPGGDFVIPLESALPPVTDATIDGTSQPGYDGAPLIVLDGSDIGAGEGALRLDGNVTVRALAVINTNGNGITLGGGNVVERSYVGTANGTSAAGNSTGIYVNGSGNQIGGPGGAGNVVSANAWGIVFGTFGSANAVEGNLIGTTASGNSPLGNTIDGILVEGPNNTIGGFGGRRNVISGNDRDGVRLGPSGNGTLIQNNAIGLGSGGNEVENGGAGVAVVDPAEVTIRENAIGGNTGLGIDLFANGQPGVTPNDPGDGDTGPNHLQNFPVLTQVTRSPEGHPRVVGTLNSTPFQAFTIDYYASASCDASGFGEGARWLGTSVFGTEPDGNAAIDTGSGLTSPVSPGEFVTATATAADGSTSEFSACVQVLDAGPHVIGSLTTDVIYLRSFMPNAVATVFVPGHTIGQLLDAQGNSFLDRTVHQRDLAPGLPITVDDGATVKSLVLEAITIDSVDVGTDTVSGTAPPGRTVDVFLFAGDTQIDVWTTTADAAGDWSLVLGADVGYGMTVAADLVDADGDRSRAEFVVSAPLVVTNTNDSGAGSLRQAILDANATLGPDEIHFAIPGQGPHTIQPTIPLPAITEAVTIDGYTQPGAQPHSPGSGVSGLSDVVLMVEIDGSLASSSPVLEVTGSGSVLRGLVLHSGIYGVAVRGLGATGNRLEGNFVGTNPAGTAARTNGIYGVLVSQNASGNVVEGNLISGNTGSQGTNGNGVGLALGAHHNTVARNWIGTRRNGVDTLPNATGVAILSGAHDNEVGGETFPNNFIAGNDGSGVHVQQSGTDRNLVRGNFIGVTWILGEDDRRDVGNGGDGVSVIGGSQTAILANTIANNGGAGVRSTFDAQRTTIQSRIRNSGQLGIDVGPFGVTPNDTPDANGVQNFPVLTSAAQTETGGLVEVAGTLDTLPGSYTINVFQTEFCDPSGHGEGQAMKGAITVETDEFGHASFTHSFAPGDEPTGQVVTATATSSDGSTSEFSACATISAPEGAAQSLALSVDEPTGGVGAASVPLASVPGAYYPLFAGVPQAAPIPSSAVGAAPIPSSPIPSSPIPSSPIPSSPIPSSPIPSSGLAGVPDFVLDQILLSSIPGVDWASILGTSVPLQTLSLLDVKDELLASSATVGQLGLERTVFRNARFLSFFFGGITLDKIPPYTQAAWCALLTSCAGVDVAQTTVLGLDLAGYISDFAALGEVTIGQITGGLSGPASAPIPSSPIPSSPIPSSAILQTSLESVLIGSLPIPSSVVDCSKLSGDCNSQTLGDAARAGAVKSTATWADVLPAIGDREMVEFVTAYIGLANLPWETFPIDGFQLFAGTGQSFHYHLDASIVCPVAPTTSVNVLLGHGFVVKPGSSRLRIGSGAFGPVADPATSPVTGATWSLALPACAPGAKFQQIRLDFEALAGFRLGTFRGSVNVTGGSFTKTATAQAPTTIVQNHEIDDDPGSSPVVEKDVLVVGSITAGDTLDARRFDLSGLAPGTVVQAYLRPPTGTDLDLYLSKPAQQGLLSSPIPSSPIPSSPIPSSPLEDPGTSVNTQSSNLPPEGLADAPIPSSEISSSSISRSDEVEVARVVVQNGDTGFLRVVVAGYNGAHSADPYTLRIKVIPPPQLPDCQPRSFSFAGSNGTLPVGVGADTKALFLVNRGSMERTYGAAAVATLRAKLAEVAARDEVLGEVVEIDGDLEVRAAKTAWDADPCSIEQANDYVREINALLAGYRALLPDLESIVLVGTDEQIAMARVPDLVADTNESTAAVDVAFTTAAGGAAPVSNALYGALATGHVLTDSAYGAATKIPFLGRELYLEEDAVGRLVETPAEIVGTLQQYLDSEGLLDLQSSFTTGYDFMQDGAEEVNAAFGDVVGPAQATAEINDLWGPAAVSGLLSGAEPAPSLFSPNAHTNHWQLLPATASLADLVSSGLLPTTSGPQFPGAVILTIGCHAGLNVADTLPSGGVPERQRDWAQGYLQNRAAVYVANTGYGYGHYEAVALSERLFSLLARNLSTAGTLGEAWVEAKQQYFSTMGAYDVYDEKALVQATFYGLPFWRLDDGAGTLAFSASSSAAPALGPDPLGSGLQVATHATTPTLTRTDVPGRGSFWAPPDGDLEFHHRRSLQPRLAFPFDRSGALTAHGVRLRALTTADHTGVDPLYGNATIASAAREPEPNIVDTFWPAAPISLHRLPSGDANVVFVAGQSRPNDVQRLFTHAAFDVLYSSSSDLTPPEIVGSSAFLGASTTFWVQARGGPVRAFVLYTTGTPVWTFLQLQPVAGTPGLFSATVPSLGGTGVEFAAGVEDAAGNVGYIFNKGELLTPAAPEESGFAISITSPGQQEELFLNEQRSAVYGCASAAGVRTCAGPVATGAAVPTGTPGAHSFTVEGTDLTGASASRTHRYTVRYRFSGFKAPLQSGLNAVKAGQTVPVKWSLGDVASSFVRSLASVRSVSSSQIACPGAASTTITEVASASSSSLNYDSATEQFVYNWRTERAWAGQCRRLSVELADGTTRTADFLLR